MFPPILRCSWKDTLHGIWFLSEVSSKSTLLIFVSRKYLKCLSLRVSLFFFPFWASLGWEWVGEGAEGTGTVVLRHARQVPRHWTTYLVAQLTSWLSACWITSVCHHAGWEPGLTDSSCSLMWNGFLFLTLHFLCTWDPFIFTHKLFPPHFDCLPWYLIRCTQ